MGLNNVRGALARPVLSAYPLEKTGDGAMATYREIAIEQMVLTVEEALSRVLDYWGDLPPSMKEAIERFRVELGAAIDSVEFVRKALATQAPETDTEEGSV